MTTIGHVVGAVIAVLFYALILVFCVCAVLQDLGRDRRRRRNWR